MTIGLSVQWGLDTIRDMIDLTDDANGVEVVGRDTSGDGITATETIDLNFRDAAYGRALTNRLLRLIGPGGQASLYARTGLGQPVYLLLSTPDAGDLWQARIIPAPDSNRAGTVEWEADTLFPWRLPKGRGRCRVTITRRDYWEKYYVAPLPLTNGNGTTSAGLTLYNHHDATVGHDNYLQIAAADLAGDLPAPVHIEVQSSDTLSTVYLAHNANSNPDTMPWIWEGEALTADGATVTPTADAACSGGSYGLVAWGTDTETLLGHWTIGPAFYAGNWFRVLARINALDPTGLTLRLGLANDRGYAVKGPEVYPAASHELQDLGALQIAPLLPFVGGTRHALSLQLWGRVPTIAAHSFGLDYIQLSTLDGWRVHRNATGIPAGLALVDNPADDKVYYSQAPGISNDITPPTSLPEGQPILLVPNRLQRIYILAEKAGGTAPIGQTFTVQAWVRARRYAL